MRKINVNFRQENNAKRIEDITVRECCCALLESWGKGWGVGEGVGGEHVNVVKNRFLAGADNGKTTGFV